MLIALLLAYASGGASSFSVISPRFISSSVSTAACRSRKTPQLMPTPIPGADNLSQGDRSAGQFCADRPAQEPVVMEDADLGHVSRIEAQGDRFVNVRCQRR